MTKTNIALAAIAVVLGTGCFLLFRDSGVQRGRVRVLEAQVTELRREMMADTTASQSTSPDIALAAQTATHPVPQPSTPAAAKPATAADTKWRAVLADPAYRRARLAEARLALHEGYPQLVTELGLSADEAKRFLDLLAEQRLREVESAVKRQSGQYSMERESELYAQAEKERREFLGEERFRTWAEYVRSAEARAFVSDLRTQLATTSSPLREEQIKPFVKALATEHERHAVERKENYQAENSRAGEWTESTPAAEQVEYMERRAALIDESLDRQQEIAAMHLDSVQQREFDAMLDRRRERARIEVESFRAHLEAAERTRARAR